MESKEQKQWREPTDGDLWGFIVEVDHTSQVLIGAFEKCTFGEKLTKGVGDIEPDKIAILHFLQKLNKGACQIIEHRIPIDAGSATNKKPILSVAMDEPGAQTEREKHEANSEGAWVQDMDEFVTDVKYKLQFLCSHFGEILDNCDKPTNHTLAHVEVERDGRKEEVFGRLVDGFSICEDDFRAIDHLLCGLKNRADELWGTF